MSKAGWTEPMRPSTQEGGETGLVDRVRGGDRAACEILVRTHGGRMLAVVRRILADEEEAHDVVREAFDTAFRSIQHVRGGTPLFPWLHRIAVQAALARLRSEPSREEQSLESLLPSFDETGHHRRPPLAWPPDPEDKPRREELQARVRDAIASLPDSYRTVLLLRDIEELGARETAALLRITESTVNLRLHRARQALRSLIEPVMTLFEPEVDK